MQPTAFFEKIAAFARRFADLPTDQLLELRHHVSRRTLEAEEYFSRAEDSCDEVALILSGLVKKYYLSENGEERIKGFGKQWQMIGAYADILRGIPARFSIQALQRTELVVVKYSTFKTFYPKHPAWEKFGRRMAEELFIERETREFELLTMSAEERYKEFHRQFPDLEDLVPQKLIAGYLGIHPVSLSRIRSKQK